MAIASNMLTQLLADWSRGDAEALDKLSSTVYQELRRLARRYMRGERSGHDFQTTDLVHEVFIRIIDWKSVDWKNRAHFFAVAAKMMRLILVDDARERGAQKRGGEWKQVSLSKADFLRPQAHGDLVAVDDSLKALALLDPRKSEVVELRFFGGLTEKETAEVLKVSVDTVQRDWRFAKSWLLREMSRAGQDR